MSRGGFEILGAVIAGGLSRRMGERDKLWLDLGGEPLIVRAARLLSAQTGEVVLNVNRDDDRLAALGLPVISDRTADFLGPLAGILAVLDWARANRPGATHIATISADSPFFPADLVSRLTVGVGRCAERIAIAFCEDYPQPVFSLWPVASLEPLEAFLAETGSLKVMGFVRTRDWTRVDFEAGHPHAFFNINTPADHDTACGLISAMAVRP